MIRRAFNAILAWLLSLILDDHLAYLDGLERDYKRNGLEPTDALREFRRQAEDYRCRIAILRGAA